MRNRPFAGAVAAATAAGHPLHQSPQIVRLEVPFPYFEQSAP